jgi:aminopeptidase YwaD
VSGEIAFNYTVLISHFDRVQASEGWHESALMIKDKLAEMGYEDATIEGWPSNGSRYYYTYQTPIGWRAKKAVLWMVSPERERLCSYEGIPFTLVKYSNSADVEAELIDVGAGVGDKSYTGKDVKGKIVLATDYETLNYVDGRRSLLDICRAVFAEYGPVDLNTILAFFHGLERVELVQLNGK